MPEQNNRVFANVSIIEASDLENAGIPYPTGPVHIAFVQQADIDSGDAVVENGIVIHWDEMGGSARPERVLQLALARIETLHAALPCGENEHVMRHLKEALRWEELRNERRRAQGVQGTWQPHREESGT